MKAILWTIGIAIFTTTCAFVAQTQEGGSQPVKEKKKAVFLKVIVSFSEEPGNDAIPVENWIAKKLGDLKKGKVAAATGWMRLADFGAEESDLWDGTIDGKGHGCPTSAKVEISDDGKLIHVTATGWAPFAMDMRLLENDNEAEKDEFDDTVSIASSLGNRELAIVGDGHAYLAIMVGSAEHEPGVSPDQGKVFDPKARILASLIEDGNWTESKKAISERADVSAPINMWNRSAMHVVAASSSRNPSASLRIAKRLVEAGADVNAKTSSGLTPLHEAARTGSLEMVALLLENRAEVNAQIQIQHCLDPDHDANRSTPLDIAMMRQDERIIKLLKEKGGTVWLALYLRC